MKYYRFFLFVLILLYTSNSSGQQVGIGLQRFFQPPVLPAIWYDAIGVPPSVYRNYYKSIQIPIDNNSKVYFYKPASYYTKETHRQIIELGMMRRVIEKEKFNPYLIKFNILPDAYFALLSMPIYLKIPDKVQLFPEKFELPQKKLLKRGELIILSPVFDDIMASFAERNYTYEKLMESAIRTYPHLVDDLWNNIPDPPQIRPRDTSQERRRFRESLNETFTAATPTLPDRLDKIEILKSKWKYSGTENISFSQAYVNNWVQGGKSSQSLLSDLRFNAVYTEEKLKWENGIIHKLGLISYKLETPSLSGKKNNTQINDDLLDISSKYGVNATKKWYYSLLFNMRTQLFNGYSSGDVEKETPISAFMSPAYLTLAAGMDFKAGKNDNFTLLISPLTAKATMVLDTAKVDQTRYSIEKDKRVKFLSGGSLTNKFSWQISPSIKITSAANFFYDYFAKENKIQADWDFILDMRINVFLSTRITTNFRYYENESKSLQTRENMSISFRYNF